MTHTTPRAPELPASPTARPSSVSKRDPPEIRTATAPISAEAVAPATNAAATVRPRVPDGRAPQIALAVMAMTAASRKRTVAA